MADPSNPQTAKRLAAGKSLGGRPSDYRPEYCQAIIDWFSVDATRLTKKIITTAKGTVIEEETHLAEKLPLFERFAESLGVSCEAVVRWAAEHEEFHTAYARAKQLQKSILVENGMLGLYNPQFSIFVAKNVTDMRDKVEVEGHLDLGLTVQVVSRFIPQVEGSGQPAQIPGDNGLHKSIEGAPHHVSMRNDSER